VSSRPASATAHVAVNPDLGAPDELSRLIQRLDAAIGEDGHLL
jgi:hypothetical protein